MRIQLIFKRYRQLVVNKAENHQHGELIKHSTNAHMCMFCRHESCMQHIKSPFNNFKSINPFNGRKIYLVEFFYIQIMRFYQEVKKIMFLIKNYF